MRQDRHLAHWEPRLGFVEGDWGDKGTAQTDGLEDDCDALDEGGEGEDRGRRQGVESGTVSLSPRLSKHYSIHIIHYNNSSFLSSLINICQLAEQSQYSIRLLE